MSLQASVDTLIIQTTALLQVSTDLKNGVAQQIADAVLMSKNAALIPLITVSINLINTQTMVINHHITPTI